MHGLMKYETTNSHTSFLHFTFLVCHFRGHLYYAVRRSRQKRYHIRGHLTHVITALMVALPHVAAKISGIRHKHSRKGRFAIPEIIVIRAEEISHTILYKGVPLRRSAFQLLRDSRC